MTARMRILPLGNMGNQMLQYMFALSVRDRAGALDIFGHDIRFWGIKEPIPANFSSKPFILRGHLVEAQQVANLIRCGKIRDCEMRGLGFQMRNYGPRERYQTVFEPGEIETEGFGPDWIVINVRGAEILGSKHRDYGPVPLSFIDRVIEISGAKPVFMGQLGDDFYSQMLRKRYAGSLFQPSRGPLVDFEVLRRSHQIAVAVSTFSWVAAWLSQAEIIHFPVYGMFNPKQRPDIDLLPENDPRYRFYEHAPRHWTASQDDQDDLALPHNHRLLDAEDISKLKIEARRKTAVIARWKGIKTHVRAHIRSWAGV